MQNYEFHKKLRGRGMTVSKLARLIGNSGHAHVSQVLSNMPGHGHFTRRRLFPHLTAEEVRLLGWTAEFDRWREKNGALEQSSTGHNVPILTR